MYHSITCLFVIKLWNFQTMLLWNIIKYVLWVKFWYDFSVISFCPGVNTSQYTLPLSFQALAAHANPNMGKFEPMVAFLCNKPAMHRVVNGWEPDYTINNCTQNPEEILDYCKKVCSISLFWVTFFPWNISMNREYFCFKRKVCTIIQFLILNEFRVVNWSIGVSCTVMSSH